MTTATAHTAEEIARAILRRNGVQGEPHPALLEDTIREVEYHGAEMPEVEETKPATFTVEKQVTEVPCDHPACDLVHRRLYNAWYAESQLITVYDMQGEFHSMRRETRYHNVTRVQWSIVDPEGWAVETWDTKREAVANLKFYRA